MPGRNNRLLSSDHTDGFDRLDQALDTPGGEEVLRKDLDYDVLIIAALDQQPDEFLPGNSLINQRVMIVAADIVAVDVPDMRQKFFRRKERHAVRADSGQALYCDREPRGPLLEH